MKLDFCLLKKMHFGIIIHPRHSILLVDDEIIDTLHRFRPRSLVVSNNVPSYYEPHEFKHVCCLNYEESEDTDEFIMSDEPLEVDSRVSKCMNVPFVPSNHFRATEVAEKLSTAVKEVRFYSLQLEITLKMKN